MGYSDFKHFDERDALFRNSKGKVKPSLHQQALQKTRGGHPRL